MHILKTYMWITRNLEMEEDVVVRLWQPRLLEKYILSGLPWLHGFMIKM